MNYRSETRLRFLFALAFCIFAMSSSAQAQNCSNPPNAIVAENCNIGNPDSEWDVYGSGDTSIQGFATDISYNVGQTVSFKISTNATNYSINIYRMGYYGGMGARKIATISPSANLPQTQPACITDNSVGLVDCGNWAVSATWTIPSNAVSGIYFAHLIRNDTQGDSHIVWVVRNDASTSAMMFQTSDETWQAYNPYGGNSLYGGPVDFDLPDRAYKVSYNRPSYTRSFEDEAGTWVFGAEYPMVRWLEANGYDVTYTTGLDAARNPLITNHKIYLSVGHDEYWTGPHRAAVQSALAAGVNLAFFSGNEMFWKTRWENSIDGTNTPYRTLVCYKETLDYVVGGIPDPLDPPTWTGTWRDPRNSPPADGGSPENGLTGTLFMVNGPGPDNDGASLAVQVPAADGKMRFWRNTAVANQAANATYTLPGGTLGYEFDEDVDNGFRPAGAFHLSTATYPMTIDLLLDFGAVYGAGNATHHAVMYRAPSGALVFGAGTVQWSWGLDSTHDNPFTSSQNNAADPNMQQATANLFADMGVFPASLQSGLVMPTKSTDTTPPTSSITSPVSGASIPAGIPFTVTGTAADSGGGVVGGVEVSTNGGQTWHPATGRESWTYTWVPATTGSITLLARATDDSANLGTAASQSVTVTPQTCPCDGWNPANTSAVPVIADSGDGNSVNVGVAFYSDTAGYISGVRFYKASTNTGTHIGSLWSNTGTLLATATFTNETASGWQQVTFSSPVAITANTNYVASYLAPNGHYSADAWYFYASGVDSPPIHLLGNSVTPNGVFVYGATSTFPQSSTDATNYWVDVIFSGATVTLNPGTLTFANQTIGTPSASQPITMTNTAKTSMTINGLTMTGGNTADFTQTNNCGSSLATGASCIINVTFTPTGSGLRGTTLSIADSAPLSPQTVSLSGTGMQSQNGPEVCPCSIWGTAATPSIIDSGDTSAVELGLQFTSSQGGLISGIMFYKSPANTGTHIGNLWTSAGTLLGTVTFTNEGVSGWQQMNFATPVAITANTTYVASYHTTTGHYSDNAGYFTTAVNAPPLQALASSVASNGVYTYGATSAFPTSTFNSSNYWVDVIFLSSAESVSPTALTFAGQPIGVASASQPVNVTNTGTTAFSMTGITFSGTNPTDFAQTNNCGTSLAAGANCTVNVTFTPGSTGARSANMTIGSNATGGSQIVGLSGTGSAASPSVLPTALTYSSTVVATSSPSQPVTVINNGNSALTSIVITITGTNPLDYSQTNNCPASLAVNGTCTINVTFKPTNTGTRSATLNVADSAPTSPQLVTLTGTGATSVPPPGTCPCSIWSSTATPTLVDSGDKGAVELGVKFTSTENGYVTGVRFYKATTNTGTHIGNLWTTGGARLGTVTFTGETASGWQQMNFSTPVAITANTTYIASYYAPAGHYSGDNSFFASAGVSNPPLQALANTTSVDGVYSYGSASLFPSSTYNSTNYWVDVVFTPSTVVLNPTGLSFGNQSVGVASTSQTITLTNNASTAATITNMAMTGTNSGDFSQTNNCGTSVAAAGTCTINVTFTPSATGSRSATLTVTDTALGSPQTATLTGTGTFASPPPTCPCTIWTPASVPTTPDSGDTNAVEVGVAFTSDVAGYVSGVRFYKSAANTGTHVGNLWTSAGVLIGTAIFTNETASGWQQVNFSSPVPIAASTTYIASYYAPVGHYSADGAFFATAGVDTPPLHALSNTVTPDGVYSYGAASLFPVSTLNATNYWVDVVMAPTAITLSPSSLTYNQALGTTSVSQPITLTNSGPGLLSITSITVAGANSADFAQTNNCSTGLAVNGTCTINVTFKPSLLGPEGASVSLVDDAAGSPQAVSLIGNGTATASGTITGIGESGATVTLTLGGTTIATTTSSGTGTYSFPGLAPGSYTVTPTESGFSYTPLSQPATITTGNVTVAAFTSGGQTYMVSGTLTGPGSSVATVTLTSGTTTVATTTSSSLGAYSFPSVANGSYTVTPSLAGFAFTPASEPVVVNGTAATVATMGSVASNFTVSGTITGNGANTATVTLTSGSTTIATTTSSTAGVYSFPNVPAGTYTVTPTLTGFSYAPASQAVTVTSANVVNVNFATAIAMDQTVVHDGTAAAKTNATAAFSTTATNELLLAFVGTDFISGTNTTVTGVAGGGLTWVLVERTNTQKGTAEIWRAFSPAVLTNVTVTATLSNSVVSSMTVVTFKNANTTGTNGSGAIGAVGTKNGATGAPTASLVTTKANSWVFGVGNDYSKATARTVGTNQTIVHQDVATSIGDTYWVQRQNTFTPVLGTTVTINDTAPTADNFNLSICEILTQ